MGRGEDNLLFQPVKITGKVKRGKLHGVKLPSRGKSIFPAGDSTLVFTDEDNLIEVDFANKGSKSAPPLSYTEVASVFPGTLLALHENGVGYDQLRNASIGVHYRGNRWKLGVPFLSKDRGTSGITLQALDGQILLHDQEEDKVHICNIPKESEMPNSESLLSPNIWQERAANVERFIPGDGGALLLFQEFSPRRGSSFLYIDAQGREYSSDCFDEGEQVYFLEEEGIDDVMHAAAGSAGRVYFYHEGALKILDFDKEEQLSIMDLEEKPEKMVSEGSHLAILLRDKIMLFIGEDLLFEEEMQEVDDIAWQGDHLLILKKDQIQSRHLIDLIEE